MATFADALNRLWPQGDNRIPALRAHMIGTAPAVFAKYGITNSTILVQFMAQMSHECGAGLEVVENLSYSAVRMTQVWPSRFPTGALAEPYANNPRTLANKVYNGRMGNEPGTDDGYNFRGRGGTQCTGRDGYQKLAEKTGFDLLNCPDLVNDPEHFLECAVADFILCGCLPYAVRDDILGVTKRLNGGTEGYTQRVQWLNRWRAEDIRVPTAPQGSQDVVVSKDDSPTNGSIWGSIIAAILSLFGRG